MAFNSDSVAPTSRASAFVGLVRLFLQTFGRWPRGWLVGAGCCRLVGRTGPMVSSRRAPVRAGGWCGCRPWSVLSGWGMEGSHCPPRPRPGDPDGGGDIVSRPPRGWNALRRGGTRQECHQRRPLDAPESPQPYPGGRIRRRDTHDPRLLRGAPAVAGPQRRTNVRSQSLPESRSPSCTG